MSRKTCVIVGAGTGVSMGVARRFGREDFDIVLLARRQESLDALVNTLKGENITAGAFVLDVSDFSSIERVFAEIYQQTDSVDLMVYNPSIMRDQMPSQLDIDVLKNDLNVNLIGGLVCTQQVIPKMRSQGHGTTLFTGGGLALYPSARYVSLGMAKAALRNLAYSLHEELKPDGIHAAMVTIAGMVQVGTHFDPDLIAEKYWELYTQPQDAWETEIIYR